MNFINIQQVSIESSPFIHIL
jgi:ATP synthase F1 delta subunit